MKKLTLIIITIIFSYALKAQQDNTTYFMYLPQATELNPARQNICSFYLGLPIISSTNISYIHRGIRYIDAFDYKHATVNQTDTVFPINLENLYNRADPINYLLIYNKLNILNLGFWIQDWYFTFDVYHHNNFSFTYPKNLFLLKDGNYFDNENKFISISNLGLDLNIYNSYSIGLSKEVTDGLIIGGKLKLLQGYMNIYTKQLQLDWHVKPTDDGNNWSAYDWIFDTDLDIRTSLPNLSKNAPKQAIQINSVSIGPIISTRDIINSLLSFKNYGMGIDLGLIYNYKDYEFSASLVDLGFIKWKNNATRYTSENGQFTYPGLDAARYITNYSVATALKTPRIRDSIIDLAKNNLLDTISKQLNLDTTYESYITGINTKLNLAAAYSPTDWLKVGFLYHAFFYHNKPLSYYTLSANANFWHGWNVSLSYTMFRRSFNNIGLGLSYRLGPLQMYLNAENISPYALGIRYLTAYDKPYDQGIATKWIKSSKMLSFHFGLNIVFGCKDKRDIGLLDEDVCKYMYSKKRRK